MLNCEYDIYVVIADMKGLKINKIQSGRLYKVDRVCTQSPLKFQELSLESLSEIYPYLSGLKGLSCDYTAGGIFMWIDYFKYKYCIYENTLFIKGVAEDNLQRKAFSMPIGCMSLSESVSLLKDYCDERNYELEFSGITDIWLDEFRLLNPRDIIRLDQWSDYVYDIESLVTLKGKRLSRKRNHSNRFAQDFTDAVLEPVLPQNCDLVKECFKQVCAEGKLSPMANYEREQVWKVLDLLDAYPFEAMCLIADGRVVAFTIGEVIGEVAHIHIEKSLREIAGSAESINRLFAEFIRKKYPQVKWVNRQDDAGDEGLRQAKMSYSPAFLLGKYKVIF